MKKILAATACFAVMAVGLIDVVAAHALDEGDFTVSGWSNGNLTIDNLTIARNASGTYSVSRLTFTVGGKQAVGFSDTGCTPNGAECKVINASRIEAKDTFTELLFIADLSGLDRPVARH